ncbi:hypothetical protein [Alkaliphilus peptidifermentans]|uniref:Uncharacterized protein n=1 Tax=Alkaliphilus peptidifermentans DSM 18978 TaxID=1120976 RepID=A0A1G5JKA7_9FIRM|nr:hypothetical protein [Alkaliphilus peptidifermentans]SCY88756.1 hypothetical protein SAMN03080606_02888 [Alkaliphilus peptidifermentans DSM 18978]
MEKEINIDEILDQVMRLEVGQPLDEAIGLEVFKLKKNNILLDVKDVFSGKVVGQSNWTTADGTPIFIPKFSTVPFVGCLMIEDLDAIITIERKKKGTYGAKFGGHEGSNVFIEAATFPEAIARAALFEAFFKKAKEDI